MHRLSFWFATCVLLGATACVSAGASQGNARVVVMPISGSPSANGVVEDVVESRYELVSPKRYSRAARKLDAKSRKSRDIRKVSQKLEIDALVDGKFVKRGKRYELRLVLRAGDSGKKFGKLKIKLRSRKLNKRERRKVQKKLYAALSEVATWNQEVGDGDSTSRGSRGKRASSNNSERERERARKIREKKHERARRAEGKRLSREERRRARKERRRAERDERRAERERRRAERDERKRARKAERRADKERRRRERERKDFDEDEDEDFDEDGRSRESRKKRRRREKKEREKDDSYKVVTERDSSGQALDDENPF